MNSKNTMSRWVLLSLVAALAVPTLASAQEDGEPTEVVVHDRERGELSPGAPFEMRFEDGWSAAFEFEAVRAILQPPTDGGGM